MDPHLQFVRVAPLLLLLAACERHEDVVARWLPRDGAGAEAGLPEAGTGGADASPDAGHAGDGGDAGMVATPGDCSAQSCSTLGDRTSFCAPDRPAAVVVGDTCDAAGQQRFDFAVCSCTDLVTNSPLEIDALDGLSNASISVNRELRLGNDSRIAGDVFVTGMFGADGPPVVAGMVYQGEDPLCRCDESRLLDIAALVEARALDNDNDAAQLSAADLDGFDVRRSLSLDCGRYYFDGISGSGGLDLEVRGRVALFVAGDISINGPLTLTLQNGASAELFVQGNVRVTEHLELGASNDGNRVLLAVGGDGTIDLEGAFIDGSIYAPRAELVTRGPFELHGSLFVGRVNFGEAARIHYQPIPDAGAQCGP